MQFGMGMQNGTDGLIGFYPRGESALAIQLALSGDRSSLSRVDVLPCNPEHPEQLRRIAREKGLRRARFVLLLGASDYQLLQAEAPAVEEDELREALRWQIKDSVSFPVDQATIDYVELPARATAAGRPKQLLVAAASHAVLRPWVECFQAAQLELMAIDVPELAQRNLAAAFEGERRGFMFLNFDDDGGLLTFLHGGELIGWRRLETGLSAIGQASPDRQDVLFDRLALELQRSIDNFERQSGGINIGRMAVLRSAGLEALVEHLKSNLSVAVEFVELSNVIGGADTLPAGLQPGQIALLCGAALREAA